MRKTNEVQRFARWCFSRLGLRPIPIRLINYPRLIDPNGEYCFGCYTYGDGDAAEEGKIFIAYKLPKYSVLINVAHEIWHHYQNVDGRIRTMTLEECEREAEQAGNELLAMWLIRGRYVRTDSPQREGKAE